MGARRGWQRAWWALVAVVVLGVAVGSSVRWVRWAREPDPSADRAGSSHRPPDPGSEPGRLASGWCDRGLGRSPDPHPDGEQARPGSGWRAESREVRRQDAELLRQVVTDPAPWPPLEVRRELACLAVESAPAYPGPVRVAVALRHEGRTWGCKHYWAVPRDGNRLEGASAIRWRTPAEVGVDDPGGGTASDGSRYPLLRPAPERCP